jgi:hypothetical protein
MWHMKNTHSSTASDTPNAFVAQHQADVIGVLSGWDRLRLKASLPPLYCPKTMEALLSVKKLLFTDFKAFATGLTERIKAQSLKIAEVARRPFRYLTSCNLRKETLAREIIEQDRLREGLIAVFGCVEPCRTYFLRGNRQTKKLEFKLQSGRCQHFYFYHLHPDFGLMHLRLQSWFPFEVQVCLNGREWLRRQMDRHQMPYAKKENCFTWIGHLAGAQRLMDRQLEINWPDQLDQILRANHPLAAEICQPLGLQYFWTTQESEYATDVMFKSPKALAATSGTVPLFQWVDQVCQPVRRDDTRFRALNPWSPQDSALLEAIHRGEFKINGFRNRDLRALLFKPTQDPGEQKRRSATVSRKLALLRAHGLIKKLSGTHRYVLTEKGSTVTTALLAARQANINELTRIAA